MVEYINNELLQLMSEAQKQYSEEVAHADRQVQHLAQTTSNT